MKTTRILVVPETRTAGFTLTDLLVMIVTLGVLGALLLPALANTKPNSQAFQCLENQRQLARAWQMYAQDNHGKLAPNGDEGAQPASPTDTMSAYAVQWCPGRVDPSAPAGEPTNTAWIRDGCIYPYVKTVAVYHCPSDVSTVLVYGKLMPRVRSVSMNVWLNPLELWEANAEGRIFRKDSDLGIMGAADVFLLMDESPYSINDAVFAEYPPPGPAAPGNFNWVDYPASYHNGASAIAFCDGHAQLKKWTDPVVLDLRFEDPPSLPATPGNGDLSWLQAHCTLGN